MHFISMERQQHKHLQSRHDWFLIIFNWSRLFRLLQALVAPLNVYCQLLRIILLFEIAGSLIFLRICHMLFEFA